MSIKRFNVQHNIGKCKYVINSHDGIKMHNDGSDFFDIDIFSNKKKLNLCISGLKTNGYIEK